MAIVRCCFTRTPGDVTPVKERYAEGILVRRNGWVIVSGGQFIRSGFGRTLEAALTEALCGARVLWHEEV